MWEEWDNFLHRNIPVLSEQNYKAIENRRNWSLGHEVLIRRGLEIEIEFLKQEKTRIRLQSSV